MHEYLRCADSLICCAVYCCGPEPVLKPLSETVSPETRRFGGGGGVVAAVAGGDKPTLHTSALFMMKWPRQLH